MKMNEYNDAKNFQLDSKVNPLTYQSGRRVLEFKLFLHKANQIMCRVCCDDVKHKHGNLYQKLGWSAAMQLKIMHADTQNDVNAPSEL